MRNFSQGTTYFMSGTRGPGSARFLLDKHAEKNYYHLLGHFIVEGAGRKT
jgi:hypothetical protein